jgi:pimeloyl-ACP methyl ester carboxylesterase
MAQDQVEVMQKLGYNRFYVAGHDRGGRTVHRMCLDHPQKVIKAAIIDIVPTLDMWAAMNKEAAILGWHWPFMAQPADFPERMLGGVDPDWFIRKKSVEVDRKPRPHPAGNLERVRSLLQRKDNPRFLRRLSCRRRDRLRARHRRPRPQIRNANSRAVGCHQQCRQAVCRPARLVAIARQ